MQRIARLESQSSDSKPRPSPLDELVDLIVRRRGRSLLVWVTPGDTLDAADASQLARTLGQRRGRKLDLLLNSGGGDIAWAYRALTVMWRSADEVTVLVPFFAKSAATLIALGCDEILLGRHGELGPLDAQVVDPRNPSLTQSALNQFKCLEYLRTYAVETFGYVSRYLQQTEGLDRADALERARSIMSAFVSPLYAPLHPLDLGGYFQILNTGAEYARRALTRRAYRGLPAERVDGIVRALVWDYPAHDFVIDLAEAKALGLNVSEMDEELDRLCGEVIQTTSHLFQLFEHPEGSSPGDA